MIFLGGKKLGCSYLHLQYMLYSSQGELSASRGWKLSQNNLSLFRHAAVKINSIVKLSGIDWVWNCNQTATISLNQVDTKEINDVYEFPIYIVTLLVLVIVYYGGEKVPLIKCNFGSLLQTVPHTICYRF